MYTYKRETFNKIDYILSIIIDKSIIMRLLDEDVVAIIITCDLTYRRVHSAG